MPIDPLAAAVTARPTPRGPAEIWRQNAIDTRPCSPRSDLLIESVSQLA